MDWNRRRFLKTFGAAAAVAVAPGFVRAAATPRVVVVGGGFAGATVAKYLRLWSDHSVDVTLIDRNAEHTSCVMSNLVLNNQLTLNELRLSFGALASSHGVRILHDRVDQVDGAGKRVHLNAAGWLDYDYLVIATGIAFDNSAGADFQKTPHAWIAGSQTLTLRQMVNGLGSQSTFVMTVPPSPYRCPPGPYERACLVADILKRKGFDNGDARVVVLDANASIQAERHTFERAFSDLYRNIIEYVPNASVEAVDSNQKIVHTGLGDFAGDVVNFIPPQRTAGFVRAAGLTGGGAWAPVDPSTYGSTIPGFDGVYVIGDSQGTGQPKSGHMASSQAKVCADAILRQLAGLPTDGQERLENITTNSACYSPVTVDQASWLTANYAYDIPSLQMTLKHVGEAERWSRGNYREMFAWAGNLFTDSFF